VAPDGTSINLTYTQNTLVSGINDNNGKSMLKVGYDDKGRLTTITDANNNAIVYSYTDDGKLVGLADSIGQIQKLTYDSEGNITSTTNGEGESAYFTYDESGRVLSINIRRTEDGEELSFTSYYSYNAAGDVVSTVDNAGNSSEWSDKVFIDRVGPTIEKFVITEEGYKEGNNINGSKCYTEALNKDSIITISCRCPHNGPTHCNGNKKRQNTDKKTVIVDQCHENVVVFGSRIEFPAQHSVSVSIKARSTDAKQEKIQLCGFL